MKHSINLKLDWCTGCGRTRSEIVDLNLAECDGQIGVIHPRFFEAQARAEALFNPIVTKVAEGFGYAETFADPNERPN